MASPDWSVYETENYDGTILPTVKQKDGVPGIPKHSWVKRWLREGMRRTVRAVFLTHKDGVPHFVILQQQTQAGRVPFLFGGKLQDGESEKGGLIRQLRGFIMKAKSNDSCEWKVGEVISKYYRPEFDERIYPFIPPHVTRPKEEITLIQVVLPPKCVFALREGVSMSAVSVADILRSPQSFSPMISSLPSLIARFSLYNYVPGRPGFAPLPSRK
jgi:cleavage and polyadenylation specificity factor subunit 5